GCRQLGRDFRDHRLLLLQIKTQGLPPCSIEKPATLNQEPCIAFPLRVRRLRGAMFRLRPYGPLRSLTAAVLSNSGPKSSFASLLCRERRRIDLYADPHRARHGKLLQKYALRRRWLGFVQRVD